MLVAVRADDGWLVESADASEEDNAGGDTMAQFVGRRRTTEADWGVHL
jgi:hypothetical protein